MLPNFSNIRGTIEYDAHLAPFTWFRVGGSADILFRPQDEYDFAEFIKQCPKNMVITILGAGSNVIVRDGGLEGAVIKLGRGFNQMTLLENNQVYFGAAVPDMNAAKFLYEKALTGGEFLRGVPGTIGGALKMNAGAYGGEIKDIFISADGVTRSGEIIKLTYDEMGFEYRKTKPEVFYTGVTLGLQKGIPEEILAKMEQITKSRGETQPIKSRTGGSSFKNPEGYKAWELIDKAGCRGLKIGDAQMSELHCNFMLNLGEATAKDLETLGETVIEKVFNHFGIKLEWEIKRLGRY